MEISLEEKRVLNSQDHDSRSGGRVAPAGGSVCQLRDTTSVQSILIHTHTNTHKHKHTQTHTNTHTQANKHTHTNTDTQNKHTQTAALTKIQKRTETRFYTEDRINIPDIAQNLFHILRQRISTIIIHGERKSIIGERCIDWLMIPSVEFSM